MNKLRTDKGKQVEVPGLTATSLINAASEFYSIEGDVLLL